MNLSHIHKYLIYLLQTVLSAVQGPSPPLIQVFVLLSLFWMIP